MEGRPDLSEYVLAFGRARDRRSARAALNIVVDLDGTLAEWGPDRSRCGDVVAGAQEALREILAPGFVANDPHPPVRVIVQTCRAMWGSEGRWEVARFLARAGFMPRLLFDSLDFDDGVDPMAMRFSTPAEVREAITALPQDAPVVGIWIGQGKPVGAAYIDDRAVAFRTWPQALADLRALLAGEPATAPQTKGAFAGAAVVQQVFGAAASLLRTVEEADDTTYGQDSAAAELRAAFDEWLPGWDSEAESASAN